MPRRYSHYDLKGHACPSHYPPFMASSVCSPFLEPGTEALVRVDAVVNFTWGLGRLTPHASDMVSVRWEGALLPPQDWSRFASVNTNDSGGGGPGLLELGVGSNEAVDVTLYVSCDGGARLWIDHLLLIDQWHTELAGRNASATATMHPGLVPYLLPWC